MQSNHTSVRSRWGEKPYYSLDYYLKETFGQKVYKIALDAGMTCPNRDGTLDTRGCIFCSEGGSGDFATTNRSITAAINEAICRLNGSAKETVRNTLRISNRFPTHMLPSTYYVRCIWKRWRIRISSDFLSLPDRIAFPRRFFPCSMNAGR